MCGSRPSGGSDDDEEGGSGDEDEGATRMQVGEEGEEGEEKRAAEGPAKGRKRARTEMEESSKAADRPTSAKPAGGGKGEAKGKSGKARATPSSEADTASRFRGEATRQRRGQNPFPPDGPEPSSGPASWLDHGGGSDGTHGTCGATCVCQACVGGRMQRARAGRHASRLASTVATWDASTRSCRPRSSMTGGPTHTERGELRL